MLTHNVFFTLKDNSEAARDCLVEACKRYLSGHPGTVFFAVGPRVAECTRPVNDQQFDVALTVVFETLAAQNAYQKAPLHLKFVDENKANWLTVRVFDSWAER